MHYVSDTELRNLATAGSGSVNLGFFGICVGLFGGCIITLATVEITNPITHASFVAGSLVTGIMTLYFGIMALRDFLAVRQKLKELRENTENALSS